MKQMSHISLTKSAQPALQQSFFLKKDVFDLH